MEIRIVIVRNQQQLGALIRTARKKHGWLQADLARRSSTTQKVISGLETGAYSSRLETVLKVLAALELDLTVIDRKAPSFDPSAY
jgi:HTH-type transcriptional regulator/antitoxin HipB